MKYIKYGFSSFTKRIVTNLLIIFQLTFLFTGFNVVIGNLNSRDILYRPYEDIFANDGYLWWFDSQMYDQLTGEYIKSYEQCLEETLSQLEGDFEYYRIYETDIYDDEGLRKPIRLTFVDDRIYDKLSLPLVAGKWEKSNSDKAYGVIMKNSYNYVVGSEIDWNGRKITISGVLTDPTYIPTYNGSGDEDNGVTKLFQSYKSESAPFEYVILPQSTIPEGIAETLYNSAQIILVFKNSLTDQQKSVNEQVLIDSGPTSSFESFDSIREKSKIYMQEDFKKSMPLIFCMWVITIIGLVCSSAITTLRLLRSYAVYYMCGAKWSDCFIINAVSSVISLAVSAGLTYCILTLGLANGYAPQVGFVFKLNNVIYTAAAAIFMLILAVIVPAIMLKHKQPKTVISEMSE